MFRSMLPALAAAFALSTDGLPALAADTTTDWHLLRSVDGDPRVTDDAIPLHPASGGLALAVVDGLWHLVPATLSVRKADGEPGFRYVTATPPDAAAYLHIPGLTAGKVDAADMRFRGADHAITRQGINIPFKGASWHLDTQGGKVMLGNGGRRQPLGDACPGDDDMCSIHLAWAGDLDRDGKPDFLVVNTSDDSGVECLYLSSRAKPGEFVGEAACADHSH